MRHVIQFAPAQRMERISDASIDLVVTSPPYPMIAMWDSIFAKQNPDIQAALDSSDGKNAFELMHHELDKVWHECYRVLKEGAFMCINIGDATRTVGGTFSLYSNHVRIMQACQRLGLVTLPGILWKKATNAPNKFMGSGMLPCGAYVTLEHEWILVFRKGAKRPYKDSREKQARRESSFFWEERNQWFSDTWEFVGARQKIQAPASRDRNASFPLELPYRLINMYSQKGDWVLDPFVGLGTTTTAAILSERNSIGYEIDILLKESLIQSFNSLSADKANDYIRHRLTKHLAFVDERIRTGKAVRYDNPYLQCKVMTKQETGMSLHPIAEIKSFDHKDEVKIEVSYSQDNVDYH